MYSNTFLNNFVNIIFSFSFSVSLCLVLVPDRSNPLCIVFVKGDAKERTASKVIILQVSYYFLCLRAFLKCGVFILLFRLRHYLRRIPAFSKCHAQRNCVLGLEKSTVFQSQILVGLPNIFRSSVSDQKLPWAHENVPQPVALMIRYVDISVISRRRDFVRKMRSSVSSSPLDSESDSFNSRRRDSDRKRYMYLFL